MLLRIDGWMNKCTDKASTICSSFGEYKKNQPKLTTFMPKKVKAIEFFLLNDFFNLLCQVCVWIDQLNEHFFALNQYFSTHALLQAIHRKKRKNVNLTIYRATLSYRKSNTQAGLLMTFRRKPFENIVGKGENAGNRHFLLFPQCFLAYCKQISMFKYDLFFVCKYFEFRQVYLYFGLVKS